MKRAKESNAKSSTLVARTIFSATSGEQTFSCRADTKFDPTFVSQSKKKMPCCKVNPQMSLNNGAKSAAGAPHVQIIGVCSVASEKSNGIPTSRS